jgi:hypothetical protein
MKHVALLIVLALALTACGGNAPDTSAAPAGESDASPTLTVTDGETQHTLTAEDLAGLTQTEADLDGATYQGATLTAILEAAGVSLEGVTAVKVVATDGYTNTYDAAIIGRDDVILAYSKAGGPLANNEVPFRMVVPGAENSVQARMVIEFQVER